MNVQDYLFEFEHVMVELKKQFQFIDQRSSLQLLLSKFNQMLKSINKLKRNLSLECEVLDEILDNIQSDDKRKAIYSSFLNYFQLNQVNWDFLKQEQQRRSRMMVSTAMELKKKLERSLHTPVHLTGSIASEIMDSSSDFDFGLEIKATKDLRQKIAAAFYGKYKHIQFHRGKINMFVVFLKNGTRIDVVGECKSMPLQRELKKLSLDCKMIIVCLKALLKKLNLIGGLDGKLPSCCIGIALLCANKDLEYRWLEGQSFFSQLCQYISDFDFDEYQMTSEGPVQKRSRTSVIEIIDVVEPDNPHNCSGRTSAGCMELVQRWLELMTSFDDAELCVGTLL